MRWVMGTIWRWMRSRRPSVGGALSPPAARMPSPVDWSRFAGSLRTVEVTRTINTPAAAPETTRIIRELRTVRSIEQPDLSELRRIEATLNSVNLQLENAIRTAM